MDKPYLYLLIIGTIFIMVNLVLMSSFHLYYSIDKRNNYNEFPIPGLEKLSQSNYDPSAQLNTNKQKVVKHSYIQSNELKAKALLYLDNYISKINAHYSFVNKSVYKLIEDLGIRKITESLNKNYWRIATELSNSRDLLPIDSGSLGAIINNLNYAQIIYADIGYKGTQLKMTLTLRGMQRVIFKPKWYSLEHIVEGNIYSGADRHNGEVVAFYVARILGMNNVPISTTRKISLKNEILPVASDKLAETFLVKDSKTCFYGVCYYCSKENYICDHGNGIDGAIILWLPTTMQLASLPHPWARTYKNNKSASWETNENYCSTLMSKPYYLDESSHRLLQLTNQSVFDFLMQNGDRHHYNIVSNKESNTLIMLDNGKSFGDPYTDHVDILAPLLQCCVISRFLYNRLLLLSGGGLSLALKKLFVPKDSLLTDAHFQAVDRRVSIILAAVRACKKVKGSWENILK